MVLRQGIRRAVVAGVAGLFLAVSLGGCDPSLWIICGVGACEEGTDYFPPETPQDVKATPFNKGVEVSWRRSADEKTKFLVFRTTTPGRDYELIAETSNDSPIWNDSGTTKAESNGGTQNPTRLQNGTTYYYIVKAINGDSSDPDDESLPSEEVSATPQPNIPPRAPQGVTATAGSNNITLKWDYTFTAVKYHVYRATSPGGEFTRLVDRDFNQFTFDDVGLEPHAYQYAITAESENGIESERSTIVTATPGGSGFGWLASFGTQGMEPGQFLGPWEVAVDRQGRIYVVDQYAVQQFDVGLRFVKRYGVDGGPCTGGVESGLGVAVDAAGNTYVADGTRNCVHKFRPDGSFERAFGNTAPLLSHPTDVAIDTAGNVLVVDSDNNRIQKFSPDGQFLATWGQPGTGPGQLNQPDSIAVGPSGDVYVTEINRVQRFDASGNFELEWGSFSNSRRFDFGYIYSIAVGPNGDVYVADGNNRRIEHFTADGDFIDGFGGAGADNGHFNFPAGVAVDCAGHIFVADNNNARVQKFGIVNSPDPPCNTSSSPTNPGLARAQRFEARFSASGGEVGRMAQRNNKLNETGATQRGSFSIKTLGRKTALGRRLASMFGRGKWSALYDVAGEPLKRKGTATGTLLATSSRKRGGRLCLSFKINLKIVRKKLDIRGTFRTLGGTKGAATLNARGSYRQTRRGKKGWTIRGTTSAKQAKRKSLPARCRAVKP